MKKKKIEGKLIVPIKNSLGSMANIISSSSFIMPL
jgi:hypothetical protein